MYNEEAIELVFDFYCMLVDNKTDEKDLPRHFITSIFQAQNYSELVSPALLPDLQKMEINFYYGRI
jgi:hypothetical protein